MFRQMFLLSLLAGAACSAIAGVGIPQRPAAAAAKAPAPTGSIIAVDKNKGMAGMKTDLPPGPGKGATMVDLPPGPGKRAH
jgi:hypothetical protein